MKKFPFYGLMALIVCLAVATIIENRLGSGFVMQHLYGTWWFMALWSIVMGFSFFVMVQQKVYRQKAAFGLHLSFVVVLLGGLLTAATSVQGYIHLREGVQETQFVDKTSNSLRELPFSMTITRFQVDYYPGTEAPSDYISYLTVKTEDGVIRKSVSMNKILSVGGYRFYQSSYDEDGKGTLLSVNYDPFGIPVAYTGFILFGLCMVWSFFTSRSRFKTLLNHPLLKKNGLCLLFCMIAVPVLASPSTISDEQANRFGEVQVLYNNRVTPMQTLARDFTIKLTGKTTYGNYSAEQVLAGWFFFPQEWRDEPMIRIKSKALRQRLSCGDFASLNDFYTDDGVYALATCWSDMPVGKKPGVLMKAIMEVDEKVQLISMLQQGDLIRLYATDTLELTGMSPVQFDSVVSVVNKNGAYLLTRHRVKAELWYNKIGFTGWLFRFNLTFGLLAFIYFLICLLKNQKGSVTVHRFFTVMLWGAVIFHTAGILLRTYIAGRFPLSNGYETMIFIAWCILLIAILLRKKFALMTSFGLLFSGFALLVSNLGQMNPQITPLVPVLASPWLSMHVSVIMMSYALFGFLLLNGLTAILLRCAGKRTADQIERLTVLSQLLLYPAVLLLGTGICFGAVWANVSWGSYWSWDPKEVWALITFLVYSLPFHQQVLPVFRKPLFYHVYMVIAFGMVLMTYFGVNYMLGGMHSYA